MTKLRLFLSTVFILLFFLEIKSQNSELSIVINNFESNKGKLELYIFEEINKDFFPKKLHLAKYHKSLLINNKTTEIVIDIPYGNYAITVFHDKNSNGIIDRSFLGFPVEAFGVSKNPSTWGPPTYDDCSFEIKTSKSGAVIYLRTLF